MLPVDERIIINRGLSGQNRAEQCESVCMRDRPRVEKEGDKSRCENMHRQTVCSAAGNRSKLTPSGSTASVLHSEQSATIFYWYAGNVS